MAATSDASDAAPDEASAEPRHPDAAFDALADAASAARSRGEWEQARAAWADLRHRFPDRWEAATGEAATLIDLRRFDEAETLLAEITARFPDASPPACELGRLALYQRDWPRALASWRDVRARFPDLVEGYRGFGEALRDSGWFTEADAVHAEGMARFPDDFWLAYSHALVPQHQDRWDEALIRWRDVTRRFAREPGGHRGESLALRQLGRRAEALAALRRAVALAPGDTALQAECDRLEREAGEAGGAPSVAWALPGGPAARVVGVLISRDPVIIQSASYSFADVVVPTMAHYRQSGRAVHYLFNSNMSLEFEHRLRDRLAGEAAELRAAFPDASMIFLANDLGELAAARSLGLPCEMVSNNAFVDERVFDIVPDQPKLYDAVYNARFQPYKRHELAAEVDSLVLLVADPLPRHLTELAALLPCARLTGAHVDSGKVVRIVNSARCGLALSAAEGANYATMEYLLCGVPVVTTRSIGGRNWWLSDDVAIHVADSPREVAAGIARMILRGLSAEAVRGHAMQRLHRERLAFFALVERLFAEHGQPARRYGPEFARDFTDKWNYRWRPLAELCVAP